VLPSITTTKSLQFLGENLSQLLFLDISYIYERCSLRGINKRRSNIALV
jgi:hypothetical protein